MRKYFGTDGIRRIANTELTPDLVFRVAKAGAYVLSKHSNHVPTILIGRDTRISGTLIESAMTAGKMLAGEGISTRVINIHTIKPIDEDIIVKAAKECKMIFTVEEHSVIGGLGSAVCDVLCEKYPARVKKLGVNDVFGHSGPALELLKQFKLDGPGVYEQIKESYK